jgi:hypothetical protein
MPFQAIWTQTLFASYKDSVRKNDNIDGMSAILSTVGLTSEIRQLFLEATMTDTEAPLKSPQIFNDICNEPVKLKE